MDRIDTDRPGVVEFRGVPVLEGADHRAPAYLHILGMSRDTPSAIIEAFLLVPGLPAVEADSGPDHPGFLGDGAVYLSPSDPGPADPGLPAPPDQGSYDLRIDVSPGLEALAPAGPAVDIALAIRDAAGSPVNTSDFPIGQLEITRR